VVLLRNEPVEGRPVLPLPAGTRLAVVGRLADRVNLGDGGSSDVWDLDCHTVAGGLRAEVGRALSEVVVDDGDDLDLAAAVARSADAAVVVVGYTFEDEGEFIGQTDPALADLFPPGDDPDLVSSTSSIAARPPVITPERIGERPGGFSVGGDRTSLRLPDHDVALLRAVAAANPQTVVVIQSGSAVITSEWIDAVPAVVQAWYGGCQAGPGLADVLVGTVEPSGRLPFSVPVDETDPVVDHATASLRPLSTGGATWPEPGRRLPAPVRAVLHVVRHQVTCGSTTAPTGLLVAGRHRRPAQHGWARRRRRGAGLRRVARPRRPGSSRGLHPDRGGGRFLPAVRPHRPARPSRHP
jgi:hypothetical protein